MSYYTHMKVLVTGGSGSLGQAVCKYAQTIDSVLLNAPSHSEFDINDYDQCSKYLKNNNFDALIHAAAITDLEYCEKHPELAKRVNTEGTKNMVRLSQKHNLFLTYISTHAVFGQNNCEGITEKGTPQKPTNTYALTKLAGEESMVALNPKKYAIVRLGWMLSEDLIKDKKMIGAIFRKLADNVEELKIVSDTTGSLTYAPHAANMILNITIDKSYGIFHAVNPDPISRYDLVKQLFTRADVAVKLVPVSSDHFPSTVKSPMHSVLKNTNLRYILPDIPDAIDEVIEHNKDFLRRIRT